MYFTQEDYIKIENWLQANSVKDTEFPEASNLSLNEQLTIIQRGENKRIKLEDLVNFLFSQSDSELDVQSTKPIQNQAVARAIYELQNRKFIEIVEELPPISNAKDSVVYILLDEVGEDNNLFTEWIKVNNTWEKVGEFKAEIDLSPYLKIQDSPFEKGNAEHSAVLKGGNNQATNANEVAFGKYNKSNNGTQFSIGIGTSDTDRKNAVEVKQNGDIYVEGVEGRIQDKLNATNMLDKQLTELSNKVDNLPQKEGNYPLLHVGTADDLAGRGESVPASFGFRASGGKSIKDGRAYIKRIKGNSVVWNQLRDVAIKAPNEDKFGISVSTTLGSSLISCVGTYDGSTGDANIYNQPAFPSIPATVGHKYLCMIVGNEKMQLTVFGLGATASQIDFYAIVQCTVEGFVNLIPRINTNLASGTEINESIQFLCYDLTKMFQAGNEPTTIEEFNARVATLGVDMYAYNEGEVIHCNTESIKSVGDNAWDEEWENGTFNTTTGENINDPSRLNQVRSKSLIEILPNTQYTMRQPSLGTDGAWVMLFDKEKNIIKGYNAGTSVAVNGNSFKVPSLSPTFITAPNASYMRFYMPVGYGDTYNHDIMITLVHSGWKQDTDAGYQPYWQDTLPLPIIRKYFPDGMKKAGTAHDEIRFNKATNKWEYSKGRMKEVDMWTLNWKNLDASNGMFYLNVQEVEAINMAKYVNTEAPTNLMSSLYASAPTYDIVNIDKVFRGPFSNAYSGYLTIKDTAYNDAAAFKAMLQEKQVKLYYESNDWEWVELDAEDQNFRDYYNVADFGTEQSQSSVPSAAFSADIIYQFNAVDMIREHELEITELQSIIATMQAQLASLINN